MVSRLVEDCLGNVPVLCIVGRCRTGKSWAARDWIASRNDSLENVAYLDCQRIAFGDNGVLYFNFGAITVRKDQYPKLALDGIDIVVVDEAYVNAGLVRALIELTAQTTGTTAHRLVVLLLQEFRHIELFGLQPKQYRCYSTEAVLLAQQ